MPSNYTMDTLPKPSNPAVELKEIPTKRYAAIRFSGMGGETNPRRHTMKLNEFLSAKNLAPANRSRSTPFTIHLGRCHSFAATKS